MEYSVINPQFSSITYVFSCQRFIRKQYILYRQYSINAHLTQESLCLLTCFNQFQLYVCLINNEIIYKKTYTRNTLDRSELVVKYNLNRRETNFVRINVDNNNVSDFEQLTYRELILVSLGTQQIKQARSYYKKHIRMQRGHVITRLLRELSNQNVLILRNTLCIF